MAFNFGGGSSFGQASTAAATTTTTGLFSSAGTGSSGFSFGQAASKPQQSAGFSFASPGFGAVSTANPLQKSASFSFAASTAAPATQPSTGFFTGQKSSSGSGFPFSASSAATPAAQTPGGLFGGAIAIAPGSGGQKPFSFATSTPATTAAPASAAFGGSAGGFGFAKPAQTTQAAVANTTGGLKLGGGLGGTATGGFKLGGGLGGDQGGSLGGGSKSFSFASPATATPGATANSGFGGVGGGFGFGKPAQAVTSSTTTGGFKLGAGLGPPAAAQAPQPKPTPQVAQPASGGFSLPGGDLPRSSANSGFSLGGETTAAASGLQAKSGFSLPAPKAAPATTTASGFNFGAKLGTPSTALTSSAPTPTAGGFSLGGKISTTLGSTTTSSLPTTASTSGFKLGGGGLTLGATTTQSTATPSTITATKPLGTGALTKGFGLASTATTSTATTSITTATPTMKYSDLEKKVNTWMSELEQQEKLFLTQATHVNAWNKLLIENAEKITNLNDDFENVELSQKRLNEELDYIKTQQSELEELLKPLEESTKLQLSTLSSSVHTHHADIERERTYNLAEGIDSQLKNMAQDLREVVEHINSTSAPADANNPIRQIGKILSAHMDSLQWLDGNSATLHHKVQDMTKHVDQMKKEHESKFRLAFN